MPILERWEELLALLDENGWSCSARSAPLRPSTPKGRQWPRTKRSDDATAVYLVLCDD